MVRRFSLGFPCVLNDVYISVNYIMANQLIFSTEQRVFIYDQYLLTLPAKYEDSLKHDSRVKIPSTFNSP